MQISSSPAAPTSSSYAPARPAPVTEPASGARSFAEALAGAQGEATEPAAASLAPAASRKAPGIPPLFKYADDGVITGDEMRMELADAKAAYRNRLQEVLSANGIDPSQPLGLTSDAQGQVRVVGDHPDKARIEALFAEDATLTQAFHRASSIANMLAHAEEAIAFHQAYDQDPQAAVARYAYLFNTSLSTTMTHRWGADGLELDFASERVFRPAWG